MKRGGQAPRSGSTRAWRCKLLVIVVLLALPAAAMASWNETGTGSGRSAAKSLSAGNTPTAAVSNRDVTITWAATGGSVPVSGYIVNRYDASGSLQTIGAGCSGTVAGTSCTESSVSSGTWRYTVTPVNQNWRGAESAQSTAVTVNSATLTLAPTNVTSLPATLTGSIANYVPGQTVNFRLDDPTTGTALAGSITPSPVGATGAATVSVTIPAGTADGSHTVYAVGSASDTAGAAITIAVPTTITTSGWDLRDASSGTETNASDSVSFADSRTYQTRTPPLSFSANGYLRFHYNAALDTGQTPSAVNFNFRFADSVLAVGQACFYFDVRRASTDALLATHGSSANPVGCVTGTTQQTFITALPEVDSVAVANDLRIRVYLKASALSTAVVDMATVTGTAAPSMPFTLFEDTFTDQADGTAAVHPWPLASAGDGTGYTSASAWQTAFTSGRYLKLSFPSYVPSGATISSVTFNHAYRSAGGGTTCYYFEVLSGATVIGTHGSTGSPVSCNSSTTTYVTDSVSLPEVTTVAQANGLTVKLYVRNSSTQSSQHDLGTVVISYLP
jgi:hypothetical protein